MCVHATARNYDDFGSYAHRLLTLPACILLRSYRELLSFGTRSLNLVNGNLAGPGWALIYRLVVRRCLAYCNYTTVIASDITVPRRVTRDAISFLAVTSASEAFFGFSSSSWLSFIFRAYGFWSPCQWVFANETSEYWNAKIIEICKISVRFLLRDTIDLCAIDFELCFAWGLFTHETGSNKWIQQAKFDSNECTHIADLIVLIYVQGKINQVLVNCWLLTSIKNLEANNCHKLIWNFSK